MNERDAILLSAGELFKREGYNLVSVAQIGGACGVPLPVLRKIFPTKREIFRALYDGEKQVVRKKLDSLFGGTDCSNRGAVAHTLETLFRFIRDSAFLKMVYTFADFPVWYCLRSADRRKSDPLTGQSSLLQQFITDCQNAGVMRRGDPEMLTHAFRSYFHFILHERSKSGSSAGLPEIAAGIFIDGILTV